MTVSVEFRDLKDRIASFGLTLRDFDRRFSVSTETLRKIATGARVRPSTLARVNNALAELERERGYRKTGTQ